MDDTPERRGLKSQNATEGTFKKPHSIYYLHEFKQSLIHDQSFLVSLKKDGQILRMIIDNYSEQEYLKTLHIGDEVKVREFKDGCNLELLISIRD
ncbi:hypothetical protein [Kamptonema sp. UHCC 0994]|uniref:hypothetical protein n=1 Tax=Kamptonema sp. UHCC 0994 TaxID=3031329 RepID=UPI0023B9AA8F|nr:hypothetical protein [Kamptonema sp. UHCC 0994]MDF0554919.1 hypothetical protein [Kamptonema sp. UHCC 0994]